MTVSIVIMGVSGSGKSTVGQALATEICCRFIDGDHYHSSHNIAKMSRGIPLDDEDRQVWLSQLATLLTEHSQQGERVVLACSALKKVYRDQLRAANDSLLFVYLKGNYELIWQRMESRPDHYMKSGLLRSQFAMLEEPGQHEDDILMLRIDRPVSNLIDEIGAWYKTKHRPESDIP